jgi:hypothetical protein
MEQSAMVIQSQPIDNGDDNGNFDEFGDFQDV